MALSRPIDSMRSLAPVGSSAVTTSNACSVNLRLVVPTGEWTGQSPERRDTVRELPLSPV